MEVQIDSMISPITAVVFAITVNDPSTTKLFESVFKQLVSSKVKRLHKTDVRVRIGTGPSGAHTEPWIFCVVENATIKQQIREIIEAEEYLNYQQRMARQWTVDLSPLKTDYIKEYLTDAPYLILVFKQTYGKIFSKKALYISNIVSI